GDTASALTAAWLTAALTQKSRRRHSPLGQQAGSSPRRTTQPQARPQRSPPPQRASYSRSRGPTPEPPSSARPLTQPPADDRDSSVSSRTATTRSGIASIGAWGAGSSTRRHSGPPVRSSRYARRHRTYGVSVQKT